MTSRRDRDPTRREFFRSAGRAGCSIPLCAWSAGPMQAGARMVTPALSEFEYGQVQLAPGPLATQVRQNHELLLHLSEDSLLKPFRVREGLPAPGLDLGGWYDTYAFAPGATYGQWMSALGRYYAITGDEATRQKVNRLVQGYAATVEPQGKFYLENRFPAYIYDKLVCGLMDAHALVGDAAALPTLAAATDAAAKHLPDRAVNRQETPVRAHEDFTMHAWDESYTLPENLFLAWQRSGNARYREMAQRFLLNEDYFYPLARGENVLPGRHAYSHVNALSSAAQAYLVLGDDRYLRAMRNGFAMLRAQSFATGGWGPDEHFVAAGSGKLGASLETTHASFETPCGSYAHFKLTRYLLRITKDSRYGDSMERVLYNTVAGAKPIQSDGTAFYYSDYNFAARKTTHPDKWPCCSGTLPQVAADYGISAYFTDHRNVYVNLYVPSTAKLQAGRYSLRQSTDYPYDSGIQFDVTASAPVPFSIFLRIPEWAMGAEIVVNGRRELQEIRPGTFAEINRLWSNSDRIELTLPFTDRLEAVDEQHPQTVALVSGPLVLMLMNPESSKKMTREQLLSARQRGNKSHTWTAGSEANRLGFKPFMDITDEPYSAYVRV